MTSEQAFKILGIKDRNIDEASLKKAFHSAARKTHPDSNPKDAQAKAKFHQINEAYEVLRAYLKYEKQQKKAADSQNKGGGSQTAGNAQGKDVWEAYTEADRKYARRRHQEASQKAEETIRNHAKHEKERMKQEQEEAQHRRQMEQEAERQRQESEQEQKKQQTAGFAGALKAWLKREMDKFWKRSIAVWEKYLKGNRTLGHILVTVLSATIIVWAGFEIFEGIYAIRHVTSVLAQIAKWILIIWIAYRITAAVHENWNNRILSVFALLVSMELEITIANWLEDLIRSIHF